MYLKDVTPKQLEKAHLLIDCGKLKLSKKETDEMRLL